MQSDETYEMTDEQESASFCIGASARFKQAEEVSCSRDRVDYGGRS